MAIPYKTQQRAVAMLKEHKARMEAVKSRLDGMVGGILEEAKKRKIQRIKDSLALPKQERKPLS